MSQNGHHFNNGGNGPQMGPARRHDGPQNHPQQGHQGSHLQGYPPAPPRVSIPVDLRGGPTIQIQDVREDLMSESDMKEELSDYVIIRFEKVNDKDEIDEHGRPKWPGWEQAIKTEDWSIPKKEAIRKIRQLNYTTKSVIDKKNSLTPPLKRQIDKTQEDLTRREPDLAKYHWTLVQIDHQLRVIDPYFPSSLNYQPARKQRSTSHRISSKRSHSKSGSRRSKKKAYERLSLTAYFKRVPRPGVDIRRLWYEQREQRNLRGGIPPIQPNNTFQVHQHHHQQQHQQQPLQQQKQPQQNAGRGQDRPPVPPPNHHPQGFHPQVQHHQRQHPQGPQPTHPNNHGVHQGRQQNLNRGANRTRHSDSSDSESDSRSSQRSSLSRTQTPPSSVSDHRGGGHHKGRGAVNIPPIHPLRPGPPPRVNSMPGPPYPVSHEGGSVASTIERIREDAYRRGLIDAEERVFSHARGRPRPPHIIQEHSPPRPRMYRDDDDDDEVRRVFARLAVYNRDRDEEDEHRRQDSRRRRRGEFEYRAQRGSVLSDDPFASPSSRSSSYTYSTYSTDGGRGHRRVEIHPESHPLSPRGVRRVVSYY